jgi:hypothetical protein
MEWNEENINYIVNAVLFGIGAVIAAFFFFRRADGVRKRARWTPDLTCLQSHSFL